MQSVANRSLQPMHGIMVGEVELICFHSESRLPHITVIEILCLKVLKLCILITSLSC